MHKIVLTIILLFIITFHNPAHFTVAKEENLIENDSIRLHNLLLGTPEENLYEAILLSNIEHPDVAYAISILETGWFSSKLCKEHNNLFGLYDGKNKRYYKFEHWYDSVLAYQKLVEKKALGKTEEEYLIYLNNLPYSCTPDYVNRLRNIMIKVEGMD